MDLRQMVAAIFRRRVVVILSVLLGLSLGGAYVLATPAKYASTTTVFFSLDRSKSVTELAQGSTYTQDAVQSYAEVVTLPLVLNPVITQLGLDTTAGQLARQISVDAKPDTVIADITVTDRSPEQAALIANAVGAQLARAVSTLSPRGANNPATITVTTISAAATPTSPASPNIPLVLLAALMLGTFLGVAASIILELMASPPVTRETAARVAPVVGNIAHDSKARARPLPVSTHPHLPRAEAFRSLRTNLKALEDEDSGQCLAVTSLLRHDGRTSVAVNLAIAVSHSFRKVLLIDADLREPRVAAMLGLDGSRGLSTVLQGNANVDDVVQTWATQTWGNCSLNVLPAGERPIDTSELLALPAMRQLIESARLKYDVVIIDTSPLLPVTDGALVAAQTDGALLVVNRRRSRERDLAEGVSVLELAGARVAGMVFNSSRVAERGFSSLPRARRGNKAAAPARTTSVNLWNQ